MTFGVEMSFRPHDGSPFSPGLVCGISGRAGVSATLTPSPLLGLWRKSEGGLGQEWGELLPCAGPVLTAVAAAQEALDICPQQVGPSAV